MSGDGPLVGRSTVFAKTLTEADLMAFAAISGDDHPLHTDPDVAVAAGLAGPILQGSLLVGLMAGASTQFFRDLARPALSYGYDRLRFTGQVHPGERLSVGYEITRHELDSGKTWADVKVTTADGSLAAVAVHVAKLLVPAEAGT